VKSSKRLGAAVVTIAMTATVGGLAVPAAQAHTTGIHDNCTNLNKKWHHGVGRSNAHDRTSGTPVRNFFHNTKQYRLAVSHNATLDRDKDGIACEKA
jgi:Excalibur calcium-binding domain